MPVGRVPFLFALRAGGDNDAGAAEDGFAMGVGEGSLIGVVPTPALGGTGETRDPGGFPEAMKVHDAVVAGATKVSGE